jgi:hypothetical protein
VEWGALENTAVNLRIMKYEVLGCKTSYSEKYLPTFWRNVMPPARVDEMQAAGSS